MQFYHCLNPFRGDFYEGLTRVVKRCLRIVTGQKNFTLEQLAALLTEIEAMLNSIPLTYMHQDFEFGFVFITSCFLVINRKLGLFAIDDEYVYYSCRSPN